MIKQVRGPIRCGGGGGIGKGRQDGAPLACIASDKDCELLKTQIGEWLRWNIIIFWVGDIIAPRLSLPSARLICHNIEEHSTAGKVRKRIVPRGPEYVKRRTIKKIVFFAKYSLT
jgi:hypothetical protein